MMTLENLEKANTLLEEKRVLERQKINLKDLKDKKIRIAFDYSTTTVFVADDVKEFIVNMVEASYDKRLKEIENEFKVL